MITSFICPVCHEHLWETDDGYCCPVCIRSFETRWNELYETDPIFTKGEYSNPSLVSD